MNALTTRDDLEALQSCAFEGYEADFCPTGRPASAFVASKPSRVFRDDMPAPLPWGVHRALQWAGVGLLLSILTLCALFHRGSLSLAPVAKHFERSA